MTLKLITEISDATQYSQTALTKNGVEQISFRTNGIDVSHDSDGNTILAITEMGIDLFRLVLTPELRDFFIKMMLSI